MGSKKKLLKKIMNPDKTGNVTFEEAVKLLSHLHFQFRQTGGSHMISWHEKIPEIINIQPGPNGKANPYHLKQIRTIINQYNLYKTL